MELVLAGAERMRGSMTQRRAPEPAPTRPARACLCESYARATERAALAGARWLGRADQDAAEEAAVSGDARGARRSCRSTGRIVIGAPEDAERLARRQLGRRGRRGVDLALDPLEGRGVVARGGNGAMSMIAVGAAAARC